MRNCLLFKFYRLAQQQNAAEVRGNEAFNAFDEQKSLIFVPRRQTKTCRCVSLAVWQVSAAVRKASPLYLQTVVCTVSLF